MSKPTKEELHKALNEAARLREKGEDEYFMGKSLLNLNYRMQYLEKVMAAAKEYLHTGFGAKEQTDLIRAIEAADKTNIDKSDEAENNFL